MPTILRRRRRRAAGRAFERALSRNGWFVVDALPIPLVESLRVIADRVLPDGLGSFFATSVQAPRELATSTDVRLRALVEPHLQAVLPGYDPFLAVFIAKGASTEDPVAFHQDWTFTDERRWRSLNCWMPLGETTERAGAMRVVSGSHRWSSGIRPSGPDLPTDPFPPSLQQRLSSYATTVPMRPGQALVYDAALVHGSWPNAAPIDRVALAVAVIPRGAPLLHFHADGIGPLAGYQIDAAHFTMNPFGSRPSGLSFEPWTDPVSVSAIDDAVARGAGAAHGH